MKDFVLTAELPLTLGSNAASIKAFCEAVVPVVSAVQINDSRFGRPNVAPLAAASIAVSAGVDPIIQMTCRDRNRIALQSDLMGAAAIGVTSLLLTRGEKISGKGSGKTKTVYELGAKRLLGLASLVGENTELIASPGFMLGSIATVFEPGADWTPGGISNKADAGSKFILTQPCLDVSVLRSYLSKLVAEKSLHRVSVIVQLPILKSVEKARRWSDAKHKPLVPTEFVARLVSAQNARAESVQICGEVLREVAEVPGVSGACISGCRDASEVIEVVRLAALD